MSRDGSDCDWLNENGYGFLVTGGIPSGWGDDDERKYEPKNKMVFSEHKSEVDEEQLLSDIKDVILKDKDNGFSFYYTSEAEKYYIDNPHSYRGGFGKSFESETLDSFHVDVQLEDEMPDGYYGYRVSLRMFMKALKKTKTPVLLNGSWTIWNDELKSLEMESDLAYTSYLSVKNDDTLLTRSIVTSEHGFKPLLIHIDDMTKLSDGISVNIIEPTVLDESGLKDYKLAYFTKNGQVKSFDIEETLKQYGSVIATRVGTYISFSGKLQPIFTYVELMVNAYKLAKISSSMNLTYFKRKPYASIYESVICNILPEEIDDNNCENVFITDGRHPLDNSVAINRCEDGYLITTYSLYEKAKTILGNNISNEKPSFDDDIPF